MGMLKQFFRTMFREGTVPRTGSQGTPRTREAITEHLAVSRYGQFELTDAVRPSFDLSIIPEEGFRLDEFRDEECGISVPVLMASVSKEKLFDTFLELLDPLGNLVDVVLESSHATNRTDHIDLLRESIDLPVLKSVLLEYEDMLLNDGCTGIAVLAPEIPMEVQFDEHKLLMVYGDELYPMEEIFLTNGVPRRENLRFLTETEHLHSSRETYRNQFKKLRFHLGIDEE
ncbi:MAG: hypothetical protein Q4G68_14110 [Planctomycetia bacterium]|nr:hypothetical protein [Planctomycetia bacterium]